MADTNTTTNVNSGDAAALIAAAKEFGRVESAAFDATKDPTIGRLVDIVNLPAGRKLESIKRFLDEYRTRPERMKGTANITTVASFIDHVNRFKDANSTIFADVESRTAPRLLAVLDYNEQPTHADTGDELTAGAPRFGEHRAQYKFPVSDQWKAWTAKPIENIGQVEFAEFLETRIMDIMDPASLDSENKGTLAAFCRQLGIKLASPQALMELSRGLTVHADHKVVQYVNVGTGEAQISFGETHTDATGAPVKVSGGFAIAIPVFRDGPAYQIPVRLRYKVAGGQVKWTLQPQRIDEVFDDAVSESVNNVTTKTSLPTIYGTPEW